MVAPVESFFAGPFRRANLTNKFVTVIRAQDTSYAAWTLAKHSPPPKQTEEQKQLAEAMSRLW